MPRRKHHVHGVELSKDVLREPRFGKGKPCVQVGMAGLGVWQA